METVEQDEEIQEEQERLDSELAAFGVFKRTEQVFKESDLESKLEAARIKVADLAKDFDELQAIIRNAKEKANAPRSMVMFNMWLAQIAAQFKEANEAMEKPLNALKETLNHYPQYYNDINRDITLTKQRLNRMLEASR